MPVTNDLLELQQVDLEILRARKALDAIPQTEQIREVRARLKELARRTTKIVGMVKDARIEVEDNDGRRATLSARVEEVNLANATCDDFRRVQDNNAELDRLAKRLEKVDFNQKKAKAELARIEGVFAQALDLKEKLEARERELLEQFKLNASNLKEELARLVARREALEESLPQDVLADYRQSCARHNHVGACRLEGSTCTGCGVELQQSQLEAIRKESGLSRCPVCGRMIVVSD